MATVAPTEHTTAPVDPSDRELLLALCRGDDPTVAALLGSLSADPAFPTRFEAAGNAHGVLGVALAHLGRSGLVVGLPPQTSARFRNYFGLLRRQAAVWDMAIERVLRTLDAGGIGPIVVLKGAVLRSTVYGEAAERPIGDIDVLLVPDQVEPAVAALRAAGYEHPWADHIQESYRQHHFHIRLVRANGLQVEVHWDLERPGSPFHFDPAAVIARARPVTPDGGVPRLHPAPEDMLLHLASQNLEDGFSSLRRLVDLDRVIAGYPELDWDQLARSAREGGLTTVLALSLQLAHILLGTALPPSFRAGRQVPKLARLHLSLLRPAPSLLQHRSRDRAAYDRSLNLWVLAEGRQRRDHIRRALSNQTDPAHAVWGQRDGKPLAGRLQRAVALAKLTAFHLWIYLSAAGQALTASGRRRLRFWSAAPAPSRRAVQLALPSAHATDVATPQQNPSKSPHHEPDIRSGI